MPTFPTLPISDMNVRSVNPTRVTKSINGLEQRQAIGSQYYEVTATFRNLTQAQQRQLQGFINEMKGPLTGFDITLPDYVGDSTGTYTGSITVATNTAAGASSVPVTTAASNGVVVLKAGDLIRFSNHNKIYAVAADVTAVTGNETITLTTPLRSAVTTSHTVSHKDVQMFVRFVNDNQEFSMDTSQFPSFEIDFREVLG